MAEADVILKERRDISSRARDARIAFVFLSTLLVWLSKAHDYLSDEPTKRTGFAGIDAILDAYANGYSNVIAYFVFGVLIVSHLRIFFGIEFADRDRSFNNALDKFELRDRKRLQAFAELVLAILAAITVALSYCVGLKISWVMPVLLLLEAVGIIAFDLIFWKVLLEIDRENKYNRYIVANDFVFLFIGVSFSFAPILQSIDVKAPELLLLILPPLYFVFLAIEIATEYKKSFKSAWRNAKFVIRMAMATLRHWRAMYRRYDRL